MKPRTLFAALLFVFLVSCGDVESKLPESDDPSTLTVSIEDFVETEPVTEFIVDSESEYARTVLLTVNEEVTAIRYYHLLADADSTGEWSYTEAETLSTIDALAAEESIAVQLEMPELLPNRGIAMRDKSGREHRYFFSDSGEDGSPLLTEYMPGEAK